jgi:hypothetical protein
MAENNNQEFETILKKAVEEAYFSGRLAKGLHEVARAIEG